MFHYSTSSTVEADTNMRGVRPFSELAVLEASASPSHFSAAPAAAAAAADTHKE